MVKNYFSETVKGIVQDIFPDIDQLFDKELKGTLVNLYLPCEKQIRMVWVFPIKDGNNLDHICYEQISGRAYTYFGNVQAEECKIGEEYENHNKILRVLKRNEEVYVEVFLKEQKLQEEDVAEIWGEYKMEYMRKYGYSNFYRRPIACIYNNRNIWLVGAKASAKDQELTDIIFIEGKAVKVERNVIFNDINLAMPDNPEFC